jgi:hypothetical protein
MRKVLVDREDIEAVRNTLANGGQAVSVLRWAENILAQPAEAEGVDLKPILEDVEREYEMGGLSDGLYADYASDVAKRYASAALSAVTAERDRLESTLIQTTTRHFAKQWKDRADDKKLDECLSEGIAMLEAERDQYRAEVEASGWIPLTKAMPPDGVPVLRWPGWAAEFSIDEWCNDYGCFLMSIEGGERATHWKPLCVPKAAMAAKEA